MYNEKTILTKQQEDEIYMLRFASRDPSSASSMRKIAQYLLDKMFVNKKTIIDTTELF